MNLLKILNEENVTEEELKTFKIRRAVRGVVLDENKKVALIFAKNRGYYELPGGGVEKEETIEEGLLREIREETGCDVEIIKEVGNIKEFMREKWLVNDSHCFIAKVIGEKKDPIFMDDEKEEGKEVLWVSIEEAINLLVGFRDKKDVLYHKYLDTRDITFLEEAKLLVKEIL